MSSTLLYLKDPAKLMVLAPLTTQRPNIKERAEVGFCFFYEKCCCSLGRKRGIESEEGKKKSLNGFKKILTLKFLLPDLITD